VLVREDRPLSLAVAERTGVAHQSPQVICLAGGRAASHASHYEITRERLARMVPGAGREGTGGA
jgi:bacillithiol system protein YtxJ